MCWKSGLMGTIAEREVSLEDNTVHQPSSHTVEKGGEGGTLSLKLFILASDGIP